MEKRIELKDVLDLKVLQKIQDSFAESTGIAAIIVDRDGSPLLEYSNFTPMDPMKTPSHIAPVWYFMPFYSMLRASTISFFWIDAKFWGFVLVAFSILLWFLLLFPSS